MEDKILSRIISLQKNGVEGEAIILDNAEPLSKDNFREIKPLSVVKDIAFIDGGNIEILSASNFSLHFIRLAVIIYKNNKREIITKEFYSLATSSFEDDSILYKTEIFNLKGETDISLSIDSLDDDVKQGRRRASLSSMNDKVRRLAEIEFAEEATDKLVSQGIIVLDGTLEASLPQEMDALKQLTAKAQSEKIILCALAKSTSLFTTSGRSAVSALHSLQPFPMWYYHVADVKSDLHKASVYFVKFHERSKHLFRFEMCGDYDIFPTLASNSIDPTFLGYPYGLVQADRMARVQEYERDSLKTRFMALAKGDWAELEVFTADAHSILDNIS